jgi:hypothetical protein
MQTLLLDIVESALEAEEYLRVETVSEFLELLDVLYTQIKARLNREVPFATAFTTKDYKIHIQDNTGISESLTTPDGHELTLNIEGLSLRKGGIYVSNNRQSGTWTALFELVQETYNNTDEVPLPVGGISAGETFDNIPITEVLDKLLYPYVNPVVTLITNLPTTVEVGAAALEVDTDVELSFTSTFSNNLSYCVFEEDNVAVSSQITLGTTFAYQLSSYTAEPNIYLTPATRTWSAVVRNTNGDEYLGDTHTVKWAHRAFWGWADAPVTSVAELTLIGDGLYRPTSVTKPITDNDAYLHIFLPTSYSAYNTFKVNNIDAVMASVTETTETRLGASVTYRIYRMQFATSGAFTLTLS